VEGPARRFTTAVFFSFWGFFAASYPFTVGRTNLCGRVASSPSSLGIAPNAYLQSEAVPLGPHVPLGEIQKLPPPISEECRGGGAAVVFAVRGGRMMATIDLTLVF